MSYMGLSVGPPSAGGAIWVGCAVLWMEAKGEGPWRSYPNLLMLTLQISKTINLAQTLYFCFSELVISNLYFWICSKIRDNRKSYNCKYCVYKSDSLSVRNKEHSNKL